MIILDMKYRNESQKYFDCRVFPNSTDKFREADSNYKDEKLPKSVVSQAIHLRGYFNQMKTPVLLC